MYIQLYNVICTYIYIYTYRCIVIYIYLHMYIFLGMLYYCSRAVYAVRLMTICGIGTRMLFFRIGTCMSRFPYNHSIREGVFSLTPVCICACTALQYLVLLLRSHGAEEAQCTVFIRSVKALCPDRCYGYPLGNNNCR